jgi:hypothetical protein
LEQLISPSEWTAFDVEPILPVMPWSTGSLVDGDGSIFARRVDAVHAEPKRYHVTRERAM